MFNKNAIIWALYDAGNSVFPLIITSSLFPVFFYAQLANIDALTLCGIKVSKFTTYNGVLALGSLLAFCISIVVAPISDKYGVRKDFLFFFAVIGSVAVAFLYFFSVDYIETFLLLLILSAIGYHVSFVCYNAFLVISFSKEEQNQVSGLGFSVGYVGSSIILAISLIWMTSVSRENWDKIIRTAFLVSGAWWIILAIIPYFYLKQEETYKPDAFQILKKALYLTINTKDIFKFLLAYLFYNSGVQAIMFSSVLFVKEKINPSDDIIILIILIIQFIAVGGAFVISYLADKYGNIKVIISILVIWGIAMIYAFLMKSLMDFIIMAGIIGFFMGGIQSLSRSTFSRRITGLKYEASFFAIYDFIDKISTFLGTGTIALISYLTGSVVWSPIILLFFFAISLLILSKLKNNL